MQHSTLTPRPSHRYVESLAQMYLAADEFEAAVQDRDEAIVRARLADVPWRAICEAFDISEPTARRYYRRQMMITRQAVAA